MFQKLPVNGFKWINDVTEIDGKFIKHYDEDSDKRYILEVDVKHPKNYMMYIVIYLFCLKE